MEFQVGISFIVDAKTKSFGTKLKSWNGEEFGGVIQEEKSPRKFG